MLLFRDRLWEEAGISKFKYFGPSDNVTRPFCQSHAGKTYTIAEIKAMNNGYGKFSNAWAYGGGPRCRHTWTPVPEIDVVPGSHVPDHGVEPNWPDFDYTPADFEQQ